MSNDWNYKSRKIRKNIPPYTWNDKPEPMCSLCELPVEAPTTEKCSYCHNCNRIVFDRILVPPPMSVRIIAGLFVGMPLFFTSELITWTYFKFNKVNNFFSFKMERYSKWARGDKFK